MAMNFQSFEFNVETYRKHIMDILFADCACVKKWMMIHEAVQFMKKNFLQPNRENRRHWTRFTLSINNQITDITEDRKREGKK